MDPNEHRLIEVQEQLAQLGRQVRRIEVLLYCAACIAGAGTIVLLYAFEAAREGLASLLGVLGIAAVLGLLLFLLTHIGRLPSNYSTQRWLEFTAQADVSLSEEQGQGVDSNESRDADEIR